MLVVQVTTHHVTAAHQTHVPVQPVAQVTAHHHSVAGGHHHAVAKQLLVVVVGGVAKGVVEVPEVVGGSQCVAHALEERCRVQYGCFV